MTPHQCGISAPVPQTSFYRQTSGGITKYQLFSHANNQELNNKIQTSAKCAAGSLSSVKLSSSSGLKWNYYQTSEKSDGE